MVLVGGQIVFPGKASLVNIQQHTPQNASFMKRKDAAQLPLKTETTGPGAVAASSRGLCTGEVPSLSYQELKDLKTANVLHIDVRERWEIDKFGKIPKSINIPLGELVEALQMDPMEFKEQYNQKMPAKSDPVVFSCLAGTRSKQALGFAMSLGFSRVHQYGGGFEDWVTHEPPEK